jgi:hypothetical protein
MTKASSATLAKARGSSSATVSRRRSEERLQAALDSNARTAPRRLEHKEAIHLAAMLGLPPKRGLRLAAEIRQLAHGTLYRVPPQRPSAVVRELESALKRARSGKGERIQFTCEAWSMIGGNPDGGDFSLESGLAIVPMLEARIKLARVFGAEIDDNKGGRRADDRLVTFVRYLATLYKSESGQKPTYTVDPATGLLSGHFGRFVIECVRAFYPSEIPWRAIPWGAVRRAVRDCVTSG